MLIHSYDLLSHLNQMVTMYSPFICFSRK